MVVEPLLYRLLLGERLERHSERHAVLSEFDEPPVFCIRIVEKRPPRFELCKRDAISLYR